MVQGSQIWAHVLWEIVLGWWTWSLYSVAPGTAGTCVCEGMMFVFRIDASDCLLLIGEQLNQCDSL